MKKLLKTLSLSIVVLLILSGCAEDLSKLIPPLPNSNKVTDTTPALPSNSFKEICDDYNSNSLSAKNKWKDKKLLVDGYFGSPLLDDIAISISSVKETPRFITPPSFIVYVANKNEANKILNYKRGDKIVATGIIVGVEIISGCKITIKDATISK